MFRIVAPLILEGRVTSDGRLIPRGATRLKLHKGCAPIFACFGGDPFGMDGQPAGIISRLVRNPDVGPIRGEHLIVGFGVMYEDFAEDVDNERLWPSVSIQPGTRSSVALGPDGSPEMTFRDVQVRGVAALSLLRFSDPTVPWKTPTSFEWAIRRV